MIKILVVDDEEMICFAFEEFLRGEGYQPLLARDAEAALAMVDAHSPDIIFLDYRLPGKDGLCLLQELQSIPHGASIVFMTAFGAMGVAIKAMQMGAYEYLTKPLDLGRIKTLINKIISSRKLLEHTPSPLPDASESIASPEQMVGKGPGMQEVFKMIGLLTTNDVTALITGESGVGKELVARAIHENSARQSHPFIALNCGAIPEGLLESELFGHEKGAFTSADALKPGIFETVGEGTLLLDEIAELPHSLQVKLLRVLQERTFSRVGSSRVLPAQARILAATNKDLYAEVLAGNFRKDLYYRLHTINLHIPPLRERIEDIPLLIDHFVEKFNGELNRKVRGLTPEAHRRLLAFPWQGNVRELENQIKRAMVLAREEILTEEHFHLEYPYLVENGSDARESLAVATLDFFKECVNHPQERPAIMEIAASTVEKVLLVEALQHTGGNQLQAADLLGMSRSTLRKKMKDFDL